MKKRFLLLIGFFTITVLNLSAANRYWIGGTGNWTDLSHWASTSGGIGGSSVPTSNDDVFFDQHSFSADQQTVTVASDVFCHSMDWSAINHEVAFSSTSANNISVSGSYILSPLLINGFRGQTNFNSTLSTNIIETAGRTIIGNWVFDGNASWLLGDDLTTESQVTISLKKGSFNSNSKNITCGSFTGTGIENRMLDLGQSKVTIENLWDFADDTNLNFIGSASQLIFKTPKIQNFKTASTLQYGTVSTSRSVLSHTVVITEIANNMCDSECNAILVATVSSGTGPYSYQWGTTPITTHNSALSTDTLYNVCEGSAINLFVEDIGSGEFASTSYTLPSFLVLQIAGFNKTKPSCFGYCDGIITPIVGGGTPPYDYLWYPSGQTTTPATGLCAGTDTLVLTDDNGCVATASTILTQPTLLVANGSSAMISCNGNCNGTASVAPTGGTPGAGYTYLWSNALITPGISGLCPGVYTCTITDSKNCTATYTATITQPNVLTLAVTQTNVSCGGLSDGTATATITGGTPPYTYVWSCGGTITTPSLTNTIVGLPAGPCTVTVTDANLCTTNNSFTITQPPVLVATATGTNISCFGACDGTATATVTGGTSTYSYVWSSGPSTLNTASLTNTINSLCALSYTVTVTDINNCTDTGVVALTQPIILDVIASKTDVLCFGACNGTATAMPSGGTAPYTYFWKTVPVVQQTLQTVSNLCPGTYTVIVTDFHLCKDSTTITISQPTQITTIVTGTSVTCFGACDGTALGTPSGGTPTYTYAWTGPALGVPAGNTDLITGLCNGTYTLVVTDLVGCKDTSTVALTQPNPFTVSITNTPLLCNGDCNSVATTTVLGGTPVYSYAWTSSLGPNPPPLSTITSLCAGTYAVTVTDFNLCKAKDTVIITEPTLLVVNSTVVNATCFNTNSGSACLSASGGIPTYTYAWAPGGEITACINGQPAGTYSYTVTDVNNCKDTSSITITEPNVLQANSAVIRNLTCNNVIPCDGVAESTPTGGTFPFTYSWNTTPPQSVDSVTNLCIGTWSVTVSDANGCISTQSIIITQPTPLSVNITNTTSSCDVCNGTATVTPTGGTGPYTYSWSPAPGGLAGQTATGLCSNVLYTVTITDANGCTATRTVIISQTVIISITTTNTVLSCFGSCDGVATANASGGSGMYDYLWGPGNPSGQGTGTITNLCAGTYWITVTDTSGCFNNDTIIFSNPPLLVASATSIDETCFGLCNATATASYVGGTGPVTYLWTGGGQTTQTATALCIGTYIVTVTDSMACNDTAQVVITQPTIVLDNYTKIDATCLVSNGSITVAPTGGSGAPYIYVWTGSAPITGGGTSITNLAAGTYTLVITDGSGCSFTFNYFINNTNAPSIVMSSTPITCFGSCDGTATAVASGGAGGYLYNWTPGNPTGDGTAAITSLCSATYSIQVTDAIGCIAFDTISVLDPALVSPNPIIVNESCGGSCDGSITLNPTGGNGGYTYSWTNGLGTPMTPTSTQTNLCSTTNPITVTVTDIKGCDSVLVINIISPPTLTATIASTDVNCFNACDGTAKVTPSGGTPPYSHSWSHGAIYITDSVLNLCPGTYTDTITDFKGCTVFVTATVNQPTQLTASSSQVNVSCYNLCDASASILTSGGTSPYSYSWNPMVTTNIAGDSAINLCFGTYNVTVTDANLCQLILPDIIITQPTQIAVNATSIDPTCNASCNGTATSTPSGGSGAGYTYLWNTLPVAQITQTATLLCAGTYNVTVTDGTGCSNNQNVTLIDPAVLNANASATPAICNNSCNGSVVANPVGGTAGYTYLWTPGLQITQTVSNECPNSYTVVVTDLNLCKDTQTVVVANPLPIDALFGSTVATCSFNDGSITITPITGTPGYTYLWSPAPGSGDSTANGSQMFAGIYSITVTDTNSCDSTFVIALNNSGGPTGEIISTTDLICNAICSGIGSVDTVIGGTPPFTFLWNNSPVPTANDTATNLCAGNYLVIITDSNSCIHITSPIVINQPSPIIPNEVITNAACSTVCNGTITVSPTGGTGAVYTYSWAPGNPSGQGTASITSLCPGSYTLTITDVNLCTQVDTFVIGQDSPLNVSISSTNSTCSSYCNGMSYVTISAGTSPYAIQWDDILGQVNDTATSLCAGIYSALIVDALGCNTTVTDTITNAVPISANAAITDATCGSCDGQVLVTPTGGTGPYTYVWSNVSTTFDIDSNLCAGLYTVDITDNVGCVVNINIPISNIGGPDSSTIASTNASCFGVCDGAVTGIVPFGGTPPYTYLWIQGGATTATRNNLCAGIYYVQIKDSLGCSLIDSVTITEPSQILANQQITAATCGVCNGSIIIDPSGGVGPYTPVWNIPVVPPLDTLTNLCAGIYTVVITDASGCGQNVVIPVNNFNGPTLSITSTDVICSDSCNGTATVTVLSGVFPYAYSWNDALGQSTPIADSLCPGTYFVQVTGADLCVSITSATITEPAPIGFSAANLNDPLCNADTNGTINIFPSGGVLAYTYSWSSPASSITNAAINLGAATYITTVTDANGCIATQTNTLTDPPILTISNVATNPSCNTIADGAIDITVGGGTPTYAYQWSGASNAITEDLINVLMGTDTIIVTDANGCIVSDTITLTPTTIVIANAGNDTTFCMLNSVILNATGSTNATNYNWYVIPSNTLVGPGSIITVSPSDTTSYYVVVDNSLGCADNDTVNVISYPLPVANAGVDIIILSGAGTTIGGNPTGPAGSTYLWIPLPGLDNSTIANPAASPASTTTYTVIVTSAQGCVSSDSVLISILPNISFGNGISPNGDGVNDEWEIDYIELFPENTVEVYNRWGELLFQSKGYKEKWDGTYKGQPLPVGTYYYIINLNDPLFPDAYTGPITIMR